MKNRAEKNRLTRTLKITDIDGKKLPESSGPALRTLNFGRCPNPSSPEGRKRVQLPLFCRTGYVNRLSRHILTAGFAVCSGIPQFY